LRLAVHGFVGRPHPKPAAEAKAMATAIDVAEADFAIANAEIQYEQSTRASRQFVEAYRRPKPARGAVAGHVAEVTTHVFRRS
jgi:hypothetical protein